MAASSPGRADFLPFCRPSITDEEIRGVTEVLRSGWITTGPKAAEFEERFKSVTGSPHAVALASATGGMHLALEALGIGPGDEVVTPSMTWVSTVNLIMLAGATPVFADIDRDTLMVTPESIRACVSPRTTAPFASKTVTFIATRSVRAWNTGLCGAAVVSNATIARSVRMKC